jgi:2-keto-3-deoxy-L-fuconate dehydrogenase
MFDLTGKTVLVTGAGSGIGEAIARAQCAQRAHVVVSDKNWDEAKRVSDSINAEGGSSQAIALDVSNPDECASVAEKVLGEHGKLDVLVNNAGIGHVGTILTTESSDLERLFAINVRGMFDLTKAFMPSMIERKSAVIVNIASIGGVLAIRDRIAYCTTKFAVVGMTKCIALDHALDGIRANAICPGRVETPFVRSRLAEYPDPEAAYKEMSSTQAIGRMGKPEEVAAAAVYLSSDEAAFVTGTAIELDGGWAVGK